MGENPSIFKGDNLPVETVSWDNIQVFVRKINKFENLYIFGFSVLPFSNI